LQITAKVCQRSPSPGSIYGSPAQAKPARNRTRALASLVARVLAFRLVKPSPDMKSATAASDAPATPFPRADGSPTMYDTAGAASVADGFLIQAGWRDVIVGHAHHPQGLTALTAAQPAHAEGAVAGNNGHHQANPRVRRCQPADKHPSQMSSSRPATELASRASARPGNRQGAQNQDFQTVGC
jgi:hypothetical protein